MLKRHWNKLLLFLVIISAAYLRYGGFDRPLLMHPDQPRILGWMERTLNDGYLKNTVYPGGFFTLFRYFEPGVSFFSKIHQKWLYHLGLEDTATSAKDYLFKTGRHFNIWLASLTCGLAYLLTLTVSRSVWAALFSALLLCFMPKHIIHSHYLQTDIAMVFTLTLALWLWARYARTRSIGSFCLASAASGFAAGTKYTLICLLPLGYIFSFYKTKRQLLPDLNHKPPTLPVWQRVSLYLLCATLLFVIGFTLATPAVLNWSRFHKGLVYENMRVYGEGAAILNQARGEPFILTKHHWAQLLAAVQSIGLPLLLTAFAGILVLCRSNSYRRYWPVLIAFPALYLYYYLVKAPWVRSQEFMNFFPAVITLSPLFLVYCRQIAKDKKNAYYAKAAVVALGLIVICSVAQIGRLAASPFNWPDTRVLANRWLSLHLPENTSLGLERYTDFASQKVGQHARFIHKIEVVKEGLFDDLKFDAVLRNPSSDGRGIRHPVTKERYPPYQARFDAFTNNAVKLCAWGLLPPHLFSSPFSSPDIELWRQKPQTPIKLSFQLPLAQPGYLSQKGRETFFPFQNCLGSRSVLLVDKNKQRVALGGPEALNLPFYCIFNTLERQADLKLQGAGCKVKTNLEPYQLFCAPIADIRWRPQLYRYEFIDLSVKPLPHITYVPLFARIAYDSVSAARILHQLGYNKEALDLLLNNMPEAIDDKYASLAYTLSVAEGNWELADRWMDKANQLLQTLKEALSLPPETLSVNGVNGKDYNWCARLRLNTLKFDLNPGSSHSPEDCPGLPPGYTLNLPVRLTQGTYTIKWNTKAKTSFPSDPSKTDYYAIYDFYGNLLSQGIWDNVPKDTFAMEYNLNVNRESGIWLHFVSTTPASLECNNLTICWDIHSQIKAVYNKLLAAQAAHLLHKDNCEQALSMLSKTVTPAWNELELQRLKLEAHKQANASRETLISLSRELLAQAPNYWPALEIADSESALELTADFTTPIVFPPLLVFRGRKNYPGKCALIFEALGDNLPPLDVSLYERHKRRWRKKTSQPLGSGHGLLKRGERVSVNFALGSGQDDTKLGFAVQAQRRWSPGTLQPAELQDKVIPLGLDTE